MQKPNFNKVPNGQLEDETQYFTNVNLHIANWVQNFLIRLSQCVTVKNNKSTKLAVTTVVSQGPVLGPTLFHIYTNTIPCSSPCNAILYAGDTLLYAPIRLVRPTNIGIEEKLTNFYFRF